jgi:ribosomal protein S18 acetylase RimI-like enzyme
MMLPLSSGADMITVPATDADIGDIVALVNSAYRGECRLDQRGRVACRTEDRSGHACSGSRGGKQHPAVMRDHEGAQLAGCVLLEPAGDTATWHLGMLTVDPRRQAEGLGRTLLSKAEDYVREQGAACVQMTVIALRHGLIAWYERRGYRRTGKSEPFPYGDERVGVPLRDDLHFVVLEKFL